MSTLENIYNCKHDFLAPNKLHTVHFVSDEQYRVRTESIGRMVLGSGYDFSVIATDPRRIHDSAEVQGLYDFAARTATVTPGDDTAIAKIIETERRNAQQLLQVSA
jgi:hypothetical protein